MKYIHPVTSLVIFLSLILFTAVIQNPLFSLISLIFAITSAVLTKGKTALKGLLYCIPLCLFSVIINVLFVNRGITVLYTLPGGNNITAEALLSGISFAVMLLGLFMWFISFSYVMSADRVLYIFSSFAPSLALLISMTLKTIHGLTDSFKRTAELYQLMGKSIKTGKLSKRIAYSIEILSSVLKLWVIKGTTTALSMKNRGYGTKKRISAKKIKMTPTDYFLLCLSLLLSGTLAVIMISGRLKFSFYPYISFEINTISVMVFLILCLLPCLTEYDFILKENLRKEERDGNNKAA